MSDRVLERTQVMPVPIEEAFAFFCDPHNLEAITPGWLGFSILETPAELRRGSRIRYRLKIKGIPVRWLTEITEWRPPRSFTDVQLRGPYLLWEHTHRLVPVLGGTEIYDHVRYRVLLGGALDRQVRQLLDEIFDYRARRMGELLGSQM